MSTWSKKTYNMVANILAEHLYPVGYMIDTDAPIEDTEKLVQEVVLSVIHRFGIVFAEDNPNFDFSMFFNAWRDRGEAFVENIIKVEPMESRAEIEATAEEEKHHMVQSELFGRNNIATDPDTWPKLYNKD